MQTKDQTSSTNVETIGPSGRTDDIRYILNPDAGKPDEKHGPTNVLTEDARRLDPKAPLASDWAGLANEVADDVDGQLPDRADSTIRGGQVATESKRGAY